MERLDEINRLMEKSYNSASGALKTLGINSLKEFLAVYRQYAEAVVYDRVELLNHPYIETTLKFDESAWIVMLITSTSLVIMEQQHRIKELEEKLSDHVTLNIQIQG